MVHNTDSFNRRLVMFKEDKASCQLWQLHIAFTVISSAPVNECFAQVLFMGFTGADEGIRPDSN